MYCWTPRTAARAELADLLLKHPDRMEAAGLIEEDLQALSRHGRAASDADQVQHEQLTDGAVTRAEHSAEIKELFQREEALRNRLPAVIGSLVASSDPDEQHDGHWLSRLSFARYHLRPAHAESEAGSAPAATDEAQAAAGGDGALLAEVRMVRVSRADHGTRLHGLAAFCHAIGQRKSIVERLAARGLSAQDLKSLGDDAQAAETYGSNQQIAAEATVTESNEVGAQQLIWQHIRRMVRVAVRGVPELESKYAEC